MSVRRGPLPRAISARRQLLDDLALLVNRSPGGELSARRRVLLLVSALALVLFIGSTVMLVRHGMTEGFQHRYDFER